MSRGQEEEKLRIQDQEWDDEASRADDPADHGAPALAVRVLTASGAQDRFCQCQPIQITGPEVDGGAGTTKDVGSPIFALNVGKTAPGAGTQLEVTFLGGRWVYRYD